MLFRSGAAFEFRVAPGLSVGPFARFTQLWGGRAGVATPLRPFVPTSAQATDDVAWWVVGLTVTVERPGSPTASPPPALRRTEEPSS